MTLPVGFQAYKNERSIVSCAKGHRYESKMPWVICTGSNQDDFRDLPVCLLCFAEAFPAILTPKPQAGWWPFKVKKEAA